MQSEQFEEQAVRLTSELFQHMRKESVIMLIFAGKSLEITNFKLVGQTNGVYWAAKKAASESITWFAI